MNQAILFNDTLEKAENYSNSAFQNTYYLGFRDLNYLLKKYTPPGVKAIDYGCGTGRSTSFLKDLGFKPIGVDISKNMLDQANAKDNTIPYLLIESAKIPVLGASYHLFFSSFVFFTVPTEKMLLDICEEAYRVLTEKGIFLVVTGSEELYSHNWLSYNVNYPQNKTLSPGDEAKIFLKDLKVEFVNYLWSDRIFSTLFLKAGFQILEKHFPLGQENENPNWVSEKEVPPYVIYVLQKI